MSHQKRRYLATSTQCLLVLTVLFHSSLLYTFSCHYSPPTIPPPTLTSSCHLFLVLHLRSVGCIFIHKTRGIRFSSILCTCPNQHLNLTAHYGALKAASHIPCRSPAMPQICLSESDLSRPWQGRGGVTAWEQNGKCELASASRESMLATCQGLAYSCYHMKFKEVCYQKHTNLRCRWPV
jgi:hypothetical protein